MYYRRPRHQSHRLQIPELTTDQRQRFAEIANSADAKKSLIKNKKKIIIKEIKRADKIKEEKNKTIILCLILSTLFFLMTLK